MSKATKRKYVSKEVLEDFVELTGDQEIVKVLGGRGNNLHQVENTNGDHFLVSMPTKFRRNIWIKRGDYIVVEPILEGDKVKAEIVHILYPKQIKDLKEEKKWPARFQDNKGPTTLDTDEPDKFRQRSGNEMIGAGSIIDDNSDTDSDSDGDLFVNTNRPHPPCSSITNNYTSSSSADEDENS